MNRLCALCFVTSLLTLAGIAAQPLEFDIQGRLLDDQRVPISAPTGIFVGLHVGGGAASPEGGTLLYKEQADVTPDSTGIFSHTVGTGTPLDATTLDLSDFQQPGDLWVQIAVGTQGNVLLPRMAVSSAPWAVQASFAANADALDGESGSHYLNLANHSGQVTAGQVPERAGSIWLPARVFAGDQQTDPADIWSLGQLPTVNFPSGGQSKASTVVSFPSDFAGGPLRYTLVYAGELAALPGADTVRWTLRASSLVNVDAADVGAILAPVGGADEVLTLTETSSATLENGEAVAIQVFRVGTSADDTYGSTVQVLGLRIDYNTDPEAF